ncbi:hypothetical protein [Verrucosispora sp. WMMC514]|uniref:hypothetical protein n=1 Tax=Verrucosispora sp. WMMC514 TaxID=3015156 RepID=UPI00248B7E71|nr:hypothetical protein [Verrucosispora sp. WMMC514]WBB94098.1 hypothetical protein O7597_14550 [Verrucosispora sp. WMMC514]
MADLNPFAVVALAELRNQTAHWLTQAGMETQAEALRSLPPILDTVTVAAAAATVQPMMLAAYRRSGVVTWPQADRGYRTVRVGGGLAALLDVSSAHPQPPCPEAPDECAGARQLAGWLHTVAVFAAHAATEETR